MIIPVKTNHSEFHATVLKAFQVLAHNNVKKAKEIFRSAIRVEGIGTRKKFASAFMSTDPR
ncbi:hypothetical protein [Enterobacter hormaechei]|uniref:hypothetical protein n=1 Tax=Enterobacter hormaechei TaxID=158836 RepID=UPI001CA52512|nr:hypothetical protein [Enterobacter hormaechei]